MLFIFSCAKAYLKSVLLLVKFHIAIYVYSSGRDKLTFQSCFWLELATVKKTLWCVGKKGKSSSLYKSLIITIVIQTPLGSNVCIIIYYLFMSDHVVAYHEKLLKTIATRCAIFSLKFTKNRLAAGLFTDPLAPPGHLAAILGLLLREGEETECHVEAQQLDSAYRVS